MYGAPCTHGTTDNNANDTIQRQKRVGLLYIYRKHLLVQHYNAYEEHNYKIDNNLRRLNVHRLYSVQLY